MTLPPPATAHPALATLPGIRHGFFGRAGGVSHGVYESLNAGFGSRDRPEAVRENRHRIAAALGAPSTHLLTVHQVHSTDVVSVSQPWSPANAPRADGMVTNRPGLALAALAADCAPILLADAEAGVIGAAHAGWRGAKAGMGEAVVEAMCRLGAQRTRIVAVVGPCIGPRSYEVGDEFRAAFMADTAENARYFTQGRPGHALFNLPGYVTDRLVGCGVASAHWLGHDTLAQPEDYFSYRANTLAGLPDYGRNLSALILTN
jgi:polyphenol oxidase